MFSGSRCNSLPERSAAGRPPHLFPVDLKAAYVGDTLSGLGIDDDQVLVFRIKVSPSPLDDGQNGIRRLVDGDNDPVIAQ